MQEGFNAAALLIGLSEILIVDLGDDGRFMVDYHVQYRIMTELCMCKLYLTVRHALERKPLKMKYQYAPEFRIYTAIHF